MLLSKKIKKNPTIPINTIDAVDSTRSVVVSAAITKIMVPTAPTSKQERFFLKHSNNVGHPSQADIGASIIRYTIVAAATEKAIHKPGKIKLKYPKENNTAIIIPKIIPKIAAVTPHPQVQFLFVFIFIILPLLYYDTESQSVKNFDIKFFARVLKYNYLIMETHCKIIFLYLNKRE